MNTVSKILIVTAGVLTMAGEAASAKYAPYVPDRTAAIAAAPADDALNQPLGAMRESHYFNAPAPTGGSPVFRCRGNTSLFDKATLVRTC